MISSKLVEVINFNPIGSDERGGTYSYKIDFKQDEYLFLQRKKGSISGNSYKKGLIPTMNPQIFILITGNIRICYRKLNTNDIVTEIIEAPSIIKVYPNVILTIEALEDFTMIECNSIEDVRKDRMKETL